MVNRAWMKWPRPWRALRDAHPRIVAGMVLAIAAPPDGHRPRVQARAVRLGAGAHARRHDENRAPASRCHRRLGGEPPRDRRRAGAPAGAGRHGPAPGRGHRETDSCAWSAREHDCARCASAWAGGDGHAPGRRLGPPLGKRSVARVVDGVPLDGAGLGLRRAGVAGAGERQIPGALGPLAIFLDSGAVLYSRPAEGPLSDASYVLPGSVRAEAPDLEAIREDLQPGMAVYFH